MDSKIGLIVQLNGVILITVLSICLRRSIHLTALKYWTTAWLCLSFALISLRLAFSYDEYSSILFTYYFLGGYLFGLMLIAGCRSLSIETEPTGRIELMILPFILVALGLPQLAGDFNDALTIHSVILSALYGTALFYLRRIRGTSFGWVVMQTSLALLIVNFITSAVASSIPALTVKAAIFLSYNSAIDLVLETALGFGMVIILLEKVLNETKDTNHRLRVAQKQLEALVHTDPLTMAFNRHAFYGFVRKQGDEDMGSSGCVGFFDIDDLKAINDCFGHAAGDMAIRAVVRSIREIIRAEDLIYRWGGDEFFVIMVSMASEMAENRMTRLESLLQHVYVEGVPEPISIGVSWGFTDFANIDALESAIKSADAVMYKRKQLRKQNRAASIAQYSERPVTLAP